MLSRLRSKGKAIYIQVWAGPLGLLHVDDLSISIQSGNEGAKFFIALFNQLDAQNLFHNKFYFMPLNVSSTCAHHQEVKTALYSLW